jgi:hypothetical protein
MAVPNNTENGRINAQSQTPSRSAAVASNTGKVPSVIDVLNINAEFPSLNSGAGLVINHTRKDYVLAAVPATANDWNAVIPNPKVGDRAFVFMVDDAQTQNPHEYREYHRVNNTTWQRVTTA